MCKRVALCGWQLPQNFSRARVRGNLELDESFAAARTLPLEPHMCAINGGMATIPTGFGHSSRHAIDVQMCEAYDGPV